jgi:hypothetical protein
MHAYLQVVQSISLQMRELMILLHDHTLNTP